VGVHHGLDLGMRAVDLPVDGGLVWRCVLATQAVTFAIEIHTANVVEAGEEQAVLVAAAASDPHLIGARDSRADVARGSIDQA
jgi:hypothetical protein